MDLEDGGLIIGMFLEYYPNGNGDLTRLMRRGEKMLEVDLWAIVLYLALKGAVVDRGTKGSDSKPVLFGTLENTLV